MSRHARDVARRDEEIKQENFADEVERDWNALGWQKYL
jgi:hypothetical protein